MLPDKFNLRIPTLANPDPYDKFDRVCRALGSQFHEVVRLYNDRAEYPHWMARYFAIVSGTACFIDVIDARVSTKPPKIFIHNRSWGEGVTKAISQQIIEVAKLSGVLFKDEEVK